MNEGMGTNAKKAVVAEKLIQEAGTLVEFWSEKTGDDPACADIPLEFVRDCLTTWLKNLPGTSWDTRLDHPAV